MISRRNFNGILGSSLVGTLLNQKQSNNPAQRPLVLSTWANSEANATALNSLLSKPDQLLDAVESGIAVVEANPDDQSVGYGGRPDRLGKVTLDACIMDSEGNAGSVTYLQHIKHPISVARKVMENTPHVILSGRGALDFAVDQGFNKENLLTPKSQKAYFDWLKTQEYNPEPNIEQHDTIGLLAFNVEGKMSGGCSTSGLAYKMDGRVGDSPIIGAGLFLDHEIGAATATGLGELVLRNCSSFLVVELMRQGKSPQEACRLAIERIAKRTSNKETQVGLIALNTEGEYGAYSVIPGFNFTVSDQNQTKIVDANSYYE